MPRRRVLADAQITALFALPIAEADLIRHDTLSPDDLAVSANVWWPLSGMARRQR